MDAERLRSRIEAAWDGHVSLGEARDAIEATVGMLDRGLLRVAEPDGRQWRVNEWVKKGILLYFRLREVEPTEAGPLHFNDKIPLKKDLEASGVRVVPPGTARYGSYLAPGVVLMPGYVNIGAYVGPETMIDTWATVGSGAQIGARVHLSGGVGIGGVLEPPQALPVVIEDDVFVGSRCVVVEGVIVRRRAVLGAGCVITASTPIVDVRGPQPVFSRGEVPEGVVAVPGVWPKDFPAGRVMLPCVFVIGERGESTDRKTALNEILRQWPMGQGGNG